MKNALRLKSKALSNFAVNLIKYILLLLIFLCNTIYNCNAQGSISDRLKKVNLKALNEPNWAIYLTLKKLKNPTTHQADSAYMSLVGAIGYFEEKKAQRIIDSLNIFPDKDSVKIVNQALKKYNISAEIGEFGMVYPIYDRNLLVYRFCNLISKDLQLYISHPFKSYQVENYLTLKFTEVAEEQHFYEVFYLKHPNFILAKESRQNSYEYLEILLWVNTISEHFKLEKNGAETKYLNDDMISALKLYKTKYYYTPIGKRIAGYYDVFEKNNFQVTKETLDYECQILLDLKIWASCVDLYRGFVK